MIASRAKRRKRRFFEDDAGDRIIDALKRRALPTRERLMPAARLAGQAVEWTQPVVMGKGTTARLVAGKFSALPRGTVVVVADDRRVASLICPDHAELAAQGMGLARELRAFVEGKGESVAAAAISAATMFLDAHGGEPGADASDAPEQACSNMLGVLLATLPDDMIRSTLADVCEIVESGYGAALVALIGPGQRPGTNCAAWPILLPLAPFIDAALLECTPAEGRA
jgi:hypothetical protein